MAKVHSYYITNNSNSEINYNVSEQKLQDVIAQTSFPFDIEEEDNNNNDKEEEEFDNDEYEESEWIEDDDEKNAATQINSKVIKFTELIDINDPDFRRALELDVSVIIPALNNEEIEDDNLDFDVNSLVKTAMASRITNQNKQNK